MSVKFDVIGEVQGHETFAFGITVDNIAFCWLSFDIWGLLLFSDI